MGTAELDIQVMKEALLYILEKEGKVRFYALMKTLYLAERDHLAQWGGRITSDVYRPLKYGPVPVNIHNALVSEGDTFLSDIILVKKPYATALRKPNMEYLSKSVVYALDRAIQFVGTHTYKEICNVTHDKYYKAAQAQRREMTNEEIALSGGALPEMISYIQDQMEIERVLV